VAVDSPPGTFPCDPPSPSPVAILPKPFKIQELLLSIEGILPHRVLIRAASKQR